MSIKKRAAIIFGRTQLIKNPPVSDVYAIRPPVGSPLPTRVHWARAASRRSTRDTRLPFAPMLNTKRRDADTEPYRSSHTLASSPARLLDCSPPPSG